MSTQVREQPFAATGTGALRAVGAKRLAYLDNLRVVMVAGVIGAHAIAGYAGMNWTYADVAEGEMGTVSQAIVGLLVLPFAVFVMALFFLVAGLLTPASVDRKGPVRFAHDRLIRLGVPLAAFTLVLWPLMTYGLYAAAGSDWGLWDVYTDDPTLDNGPLWFVEVLLIYSLVYAAWVAMRSHRGPRARIVPTRSPTAPQLMAWGAGIAVGTYLIRPWFPFDSLQFTNAHVWQWPECIGLFALGILSARRGWLQPVSSRTRRACGWIALGAILALLVAFASTESPDRALEIFGSGWGWQPLMFAAIAGAVTVSASIWVLALAQRHWHREDRTARAMSRAAYAAFMFQGLPLIVAALALRPIGMPLEVKAVLVTGAAIAGSFALGWALVTRTPLGRIM